MTKSIVSQPKKKKNLWKRFVINKNENECWNVVSRKVILIMSEHVELIA